MVELERTQKLTKDILDKLKCIDGFPIGKDEDIIALSDPPYYTAFPSPFIEEFVKKHGKPFDEKTDNYHREPFAFDVSEGKNDPIYNAHSYHTKVPPKALMRYILHYTEPDDIIFDGFCGTGMTGVAAQMCGTPDTFFKHKIEKEKPNVKWGARKSILCELSPIATFIAYNYNAPIDIVEFEGAAKQIIAEVEKECSWMYETQHLINGKVQYDTDISRENRPIKGKIIYTVWSDVFICPECMREIIFWDMKVDDKKEEVKEDLNCSHCDASLTKRNLDRALETVIDDFTGKIVKRIKQIPIFINYIVEDRIGKIKRKRRYIKKPDNTDLAIIRKVEDSKIPYWYPKNKMMFKGENWGDTWRAGYHIGITHVHHFYTKRNLWILAAVFERIKNYYSNNKRLMNFLIAWFTSSHSRLHKLNRYMPKHKRHVGPLSGTLYISSIQAEISPFYFLNYKLKTHSNIKSPFSQNIISTQSSTNLINIPDNSIEYIFTDPPFGGNLMYSELNFILEAWLRVFTNNKQEALVSEAQEKGLNNYQNLMERCFREKFRILKPGRWITVEFHNSQNKVWMAIQEALMRAGFVIADVRTLDKKKGTTKQLTYILGTVKQDLVISAYKPNNGLVKRFNLEHGSEKGVWNFVRQHLKHLPIFVEQDNNAEIIAERQNYLLFDRMVAFYVQRGVTIPISAGDFYAGLNERFPMRDGMYFLPEQVIEYDRRRMNVDTVEQLSLIVHDERSSIQWLRNELSENPQTYQDIQPKFFREMHMSKHEDLPELSVLLDQNFLQDDNGKWYVPDPNKQADLEKLREKALLREFRMYQEAKGKLRVFRSEAVRAGFSKCWQEGNYESIIKVAKKLPSDVLQEDPTLLMYYDNANMRMEE